MRTTNRCLIGATVLCLLLCGSGLAAAPYPERPVTLIAPNPPGGTTDLQARALAEASKNFLPSPITIVNRPGGGGAVGISEVIQSRPNGYTIGIGGTSQCILVPLTSKVPYKGPEDFQPVIKLTNSPVVFVIQGNSPWKSMQELLAYAKTNPGKIRVGTPGIGTLHHINLEILKGKAGVDLTHVPFAGGAESSTALLGGHIEAVIIPPSVVVGQVKAGRLRVIGTFAEKRHPAFTETLTFPEMGYDITQGISALILAPKGTPESIVTVLHDALKKGTETEFFKKFSGDRGYLIDYKGPTDLAKELARDYRMLGEVVSQLKLRKE